MKIKKISFLMPWNNKISAPKKEKKVAQQKTVDSASDVALSNYGKAQVEIASGVISGAESKEAETRAFLKSFSDTNTEKLKNQMEPYVRNMSHNLNAFPFFHSKALENIRVFGQRDLLLEAVDDYFKAQNIVNDTVEILGFIKNPTPEMRELYEKATVSNASIKDKMVNVAGHCYVANLNAHKNEMDVKDLNTNTTIHYERAGRFSHLDHASGFYPTQIRTPEYLINLGGETNLCKIESLSKIDREKYAIPSFERTYNLTNPRMSTPNIICSSLPENVTASSSDRFHFFYEKQTSSQRGALNGFYDINLDHGMYSLVKSKDKVKDENVIFGESNWQYIENAI